MAFCDPCRVVAQALSQHGGPNPAETVRIENFDLWYTPRHRDVPVYLAAVFARGVALAGEVADGVILTRSTLHTAATVRQQLSDAAGPMIEATSIIGTPQQCRTRIEAYRGSGVDTPILCAWRRRQGTF